MSFKEYLEDKIKNMGATFVGFSYIADKLPEALKKYPFAVTFGIRLSDAIIDEIEDKPTFTYFNHYRSVNALIDQIALKTMLILQENGYMGYTIAASQTVPNAPEVHSGVFPHKTGAVVSGLGWVGKSGLFISSDFGPRVRLGTVLTDAVFEAGEEKRVESCGACDRCVKSCPAIALTGNEWETGCSRSHLVDAKACGDFMNEKFKNIGRGSVCGICVRVCPKGVKRKNNFPVKE